MCSSTENTSDIVYSIERCFNTCASLGVRLRFVRAQCHSQNSVDFLSVLTGWPGDLNQLSSEIMAGVFNTCYPRLNGMLRFEIEGKFAFIRLARELCYLNILKEVLKCECSYGSNRDYQGKVVCLEIVGETNSLTYLRMSIIKRILTQIVIFCGGSAVSENSSLCDPEISEKYLISNCSDKSSDDSIKVFVGAVVGGREKKKLAPSEMIRYEKMRSDEIESMYLHKLQINELPGNVDELVRTCICFDMISNRITKTVTLQLDDCPADERSSCKGSLFVIYNYVRLAKIVSKFNDNVSCGFYPPLPEIEKIDFSLLKDIEWNIMLDFVVTWPNVFRRSSEGLASGRPKIHLIANFLINLSKDFSHYYSRIRILTEPRPHLVPVLHARIYLLIGLINVYKNALYSLCLQPINKM